MADDPTRFHPNAPKELDRYLIPTESIIFMIRRHWLVLVNPIGLVLLGLLVVGYVSSTSAPADIKNIVVIAWLALIVRMIWKLLEWWLELFLATDRRLVLLHGIITRKVDMMPLAKVTDMRYDRSVAGRILGYGTFVLESAGQDQAISVVKYIPNPDRYYREISSVVFSPPQRRLSDKLMPSTSGSRLPISEPEQAWWRR